MTGLDHVISTLPKIVLGEWHAKLSVKLHSIQNEVGGSNTTFININIIEINIIVDSRMIERICLVSAELTFPNWVLRARLLE